MNRETTRGIGTYHLQNERLLAAVADCAEEEDAHGEECAGEDEDDDGHEN